MPIAKPILKGGILIALFLFVFCLTAEAQEVMPAEPVPVLYDSGTASELGVEEEKVLADGFWNNLWRKVEIFFTVDPIKKAEKRLTWANENLVRAQMKAESGEDEIGADQALHEFNKQIEKVQKVIPKLQVQRAGDERVEDLASTVNSQRVRQIDILQKLEEGIDRAGFKELIGKVKTQVEQKIEVVDKAATASEPLAKPAESREENLQPITKPENPIPVPRKESAPSLETNTGTEPETETESEVVEGIEEEMEPGAEATPSTTYTHPYAGQYEIIYDFSNVEVAVGGTKTTVSLDDISTGDAKIGTVDIPAEIVEDLRELLASRVEFVIGEKQLINHPISMEDLDTDKAANGFYDPRLEKFYFGDLSTVDPVEKNCGAIGGSLWGGHFTDTGIDQASSTVGFIGGCKGILVAARAKIPWTAIKLK